MVNRNPTVYSSLYSRIPTPLHVHVHTTRNRKRSTQLTLVASLAVVMPSINASAVQGKGGGRKSPSRFY